MPDYFFSSETLGFYLPSIHNGMPSDAKRISPERYKELLRLQASGLLIAADKDGQPQAVDAPSKSQSELLETIKSGVRPLRDSILTKVVQIALVDAAIGNEELVAEVLTPVTGVRDKLLNITDDPALNAAQNREEMESAVMNYYRALVAGVSPKLRDAFKELEK